MRVASNEFIDCHKQLANTGQIKPSDLSWQSLHRTVGFIRRRPRYPSSRLSGIKHHSLCATQYHYIRRCHYVIATVQEFLFNVAGDGAPAA
jgi:hypothetical protein